MTTKEKEKVFEVVDGIGFQVAQMQRELKNELKQKKNFVEAIKKNKNELNRVKDKEKELEKKLSEIKNQKQKLDLFRKSHRESLSVLNQNKTELEMQLKIEKNKTELYISQHKEVLNKYKVIWQQYEQTYKKFPLAEENEKLERENKLLEINVKKLEHQIEINRKKIQDIKNMKETICKKLILGLARYYLEKKEKIEKMEELKNLLKIKQKIYDDLKKEKEELEQKMEENSLISTQYTLSQPTQSQSQTQSLSQISGKMNLKIPVLRLPSFSPPKKKLSNVNNIMKSLKLIKNMKESKMKKKVRFQEDLNIKKKSNKNNIDTLKENQDNIQETQEKNTNSEKVTPPEPIILMEIDPNENPVHNSNPQVETQEPRQQESEVQDRTSRNNVENNNQDIMKSKNVPSKKANKKKAPSSYSRTPVKKFKSISTRPLQITSQPVEKTIDTPQNIDQNQVEDKNEDKEETNNNKESEKGDEEILSPRETQSENNTSFFTNNEANSGAESPTFQFSQPSSPPQSESDWTKNKQMSSPDDSVPWALGNKSTVSNFFSNSNSENNKKDDGGNKGFLMNFGGTPNPFKLF